ncbi:MAG TPA: adenylate/guanylate cyclase domain-containing protein [Micromonosporaceae bacterium]|nr:adenylate/guanylate cyclase domain-containing protein [Micromonosporaceae bacterium]
MTPACPRCARVAGDDDRFCGGCGTELAPPCPKCGRMLAPDVVFCTGCGTRREARPATPAGLEDRRRVSVLFIDLVDSTSYAEHADPELVRRMQTGFFNTVRRVIGQYGGVVEKYVGDAVMALFGAPVATENDALRCVRAGLELQRVLGRLTPESAGAMRFRVGISTGEALVDVAAARDGGQAILAGDVVNTASRLQALAPAGSVITCGATHAATRSTIRYVAQPAAQLRGRSAPTEVWLAVEPVQAQPAEREPEPTPLIGREHELALLVNALHRALQDRTPQLVTIFGQAGIGKTRLVRELYRQAQQVQGQPVVWRTGRCPPFGENVTYAALASIVKAEAGILDTDPADVAAARLDATLRTLVDDAEAARLASALGPLVGLPRIAPPGSEKVVEEPESAWRRFVTALADRSPTVLFFEDLHWADEPMRRCIELLGASVRDVPLLLLCTARPELVERDPTWAGTIGGSLTITLSPLQGSSIAWLYAHLFGQPAFSADLLTPLVELADGNPLYAQEYVRMLIERGSLRRAGRSWTLEPEQDLPMPDSVHAVIANRVDLLDPVDRTVLQAAAVVGMQFWPGAVAAALGRSMESVERSLRRLEQRDFVQERHRSTMAGQSEYGFRHVLVRDVCYQRLPRTERVARHERTAEWLDALSHTRDTDLAEVLAHHRFTAHEIARTLGMPTRQYAPAARDALHRAARRAFALRAFDTAAGHLDRALALDGGGDLLDRLRLTLLGTEIAFHRDGQKFLTTGDTRQLVKLAEQLYTAGDQAQAARAWTLLGQVAWLRADRPAALSHLGRAVKLLDPLPDSAAKADAYAELARLHMLNYERDPAVAAAGTAAAIAERLRLVEAQAHACITMATVRYHAGEPTGLDDLYAAVQMCRSQKLLALDRAIQNLAYALREEGDYHGSNELFTGSRDGAPAPGQALATGYSYEAMRAYFRGDFDALLTAADAFGDTPAGRWDIQVRGLRSLVLVLRDGPGAGAPGPDDDVAQALGTARGSGFHRPLWTALSMGALCRALRGRTQEATDLLAELAKDWHTVPALASGEWVDAAAHAAAVSGREAARIVHRLVAAAPRRTPWSEAALATTGAALATADGDHRQAAELHTVAAGHYERIGNLTDRVISLALAGAALCRAGDTESEVLAEVREFARRNRAPGLLRIAEPDALAT